MRFIGRRERRRRRALLEQMDWAEAADRGQRSHHALRGLQLRRAGGDPRRGVERYTGGGEDAFRRLLYAPEMHDPDLIIRTSGEQRMSNYLLWQSAYSELVFRDELWPDFTREAFEAALDEYESPPAPVRRTLRMASRSRAAVPRRGAPGAPRRNAGSDLGARIAAAIPALIFAAGHRRLRALGLRRRPDAPGDRSACTSSSRCSTSRSPSRLAGFSAWRRCSWRPRAADRETLLLVFVGLRAGRLPAVAGSSRGGPGRRASR